LRLVASRTTEKLLGHRGVLGTVSSRNDLVYVLGIIPKVWKAEIDRILDIRNTLGHSRIEKRFSDDDVAAKCDKFLDLFGLDRKLTHRDKFKMSVVYLATWLVMKGLEIEREPRPSSPESPRAIKLGNYASHD